MAYAYLVMIHQVLERAQTFVCYGYNLYEYNLSACGDRSPLEGLRDDTKRDSFWQFRVPGWLTSQHSEIRQH